MTYPAILIVGLLLWSFAWPKQNLVYLLFGTYAFGALALIPPNLIGYANVLPSSVAALLITARYAADRGFLRALPDDALRPEKMGLLTAFVALAYIAGMFYPRLFAGIEVTQLGLARPGPLGPTGQNFNQLAYLSVSYALALVVHYAARDRRFIQKLLRAFIVGGVVLVLTGVADFALGGGGQSGVFAPFKNASYLVIEGAEILGARRIVGLMSEASTYGWACVLFASLTLFSSPLLDTARAKLLSRIVAFSLILMAALSTSSTAYAGLGVLASLYGMNFARRGAAAFLPGFRIRIRFFFLAELLLITLVIAVASGVAVTDPDLFLTPVAFVDELLFRKSLGASYYERMSWNRLAMQALAETHWIGVGTGGARTSNWFVSIISNTGLPGAALLFGFIGFQLLRRSETRDIYVRDLLIMARATLVVNLSMAALSGTTSDFGLVSGTLFGLIVSVTSPSKAREPIRWRSARLLGPRRRRTAIPAAARQAKAARKPTRTEPARKPVRASARGLAKIAGWNRLQRLRPAPKRWQRMQGRVSHAPDARDERGAEAPLPDDGGLKPVD